VGFSFSAFVLVTTMTSHSFYTHNVKKEQQIRVQTQRHTQRQERNRSKQTNVQAGK